MIYAISLFYIVQALLWLSLFLAASRADRNNPFRRL